MNDKKTGKYERILVYLEQLFQNTDDITARMSTAAAVLYHKMSTFYWCGFYRFVQGKLIVGPYQGTVACQVLEKDKGVCWASVNSSKTIIVPDVNKFPGHIACDPKSKSEIVVPCFDPNGQLYAVLDVDSDKTKAFDKTDGLYLEAIVKLLCVN